MSITRVLFLITLLSLFWEVNVQAQICASDDTLKPFVSYDTYPMGGIRWISHDLECTLGMNFSWMGFWPESGSIITQTAAQSMPVDTTITIADPFFYDTTQHPNYPRSAWNLLREAAYGTDVRCYLPGTSTTDEYDYPWILALGGPESRFKAGGHSYEWYIPDTISIADSLVLRLVSGSVSGGSVSAGASSPFQIGGYSWPDVDTITVGVQSDTNHVGAFTYDFAFLIPGTVSGTTPLYSVEYWSVGNGDSVLLSADTITGKSYNTLPAAQTQAPGRIVGAENLRPIDSTTKATLPYKLLRHTLSASTMRSLYRNHFTTTPIIDVRVRTFRQVPLYARLLRIRNNIAQRVLSGASDVVLKQATTAMQNRYYNNLMKDWSMSVETFSNVFHCFGYISNLLSSRGAPALTSLAAYEPELFSRVVRDQCEAQNASKPFLWFEWGGFGDAQWRAHSLPTWSNTNNYWYNWSPTDDGASTPMPGAVMPDSVDAYHHGIYVIKDYDRFTTQWQNRIIGYGSEGRGGGKGLSQFFKTYAKACYDVTPAIPMRVAPQFTAKKVILPKWSMDSLQYVMDSLYLRRDHLSEGVADSLSRHYADSVYAATIIQPYLDAHPSGPIVTDSVLDYIWFARFPTTSETLLQMWMGITHGMKGYLANIMYDDGLDQYAAIVDTGSGANHKIVKSANRTYFYDGYGQWNWLSTRMFSGWPNDNLNHHWTANDMRIPITKGYKPLFGAMRQSTTELGAIAQTLAKLDWKGTVSWHARDSTPVYLTRLPVQTVQTFNKAGSFDSTAYVEFGIHSMATDSVARYISILNRRIWTDSTGTDSTDFRTVRFKVKPSAFDTMYATWPTWSVRDMSTEKDTIILLGDTYDVNLTAGNGALLRIGPATSITVARATTNVWNNARHIAWNETGQGSSHAYWSVYERKGRIYAQSPLEINEDMSRRRPDTLAEVVLDSSGKAHFPAIAINPEIISTYRGGYGVVYSIEHGGVTADSTFIVFKFASVDNPRHYLVTDTLEKFKVTNSHYIATPAISVAKRINLPKWGGKNYQFWVSWRNPDRGGAITLVDTAGRHSSIKYFSAGDSIESKFVSIASRIGFRATNAISNNRCYIAWQEVPSSMHQPEIAVADFGNIYYLEAWQDTNSVDQIDTGGLFRVSAGLHDCNHRTPCINISPDERPEVSWEHQNYWGGFRVKGGSKYVATRKRLAGSWSDFVNWRVETPHVADYSADTILSLPQNELAGVHLQSPPAYWNDVDRIAWNNNYLKQSSIAHMTVGMPVVFTWARHNLAEPSLEPSIPVPATAHDAMLDPIHFRSPQLRSDTSYELKVTRYDFPYTPVSLDTARVLTIVASKTDDCPYQMIRVGGDKNPTVTSPSGPSIRANWQTPEKHAYDSIEVHSPLDWSNPSIRTTTFSGNAGDSLYVGRFMRTGAFDVGDTAALSDALAVTGGDYLRFDLTLRRASTGDVSAVLDTALLSRTGFISSIDVADSGNRSVVLPFADSFYLQLECRRGDTTNSLDIRLSESYDDEVVDLLPSDLVVAPKRADPTRHQETQSPNMIAVYPNPFSGSTEVVAGVMKGADTRVDLFDILGNRVRTLYQGEAEDNVVELTLDGANLSSGDYFVRVFSGGTAVTKRLHVEH